MPRLQALNPASAAGKAHALLTAVQNELGLVPNMVRTMASSPAVLEGYLGLSGALGAGRTPSKQREQVALAVSEANGCNYCLAAHVLEVGVGDGEIAEIVAHVALDTLSNHLNRVAQTEIDFPAVPALASEAA